MFRCIIFLKALVCRPITSMEKAFIVVMLNYTNSLLSAFGASQTYNWNGEHRRIEILSTIHTTHQGIAIAI